MFKINNVVSYISITVIIISVMLNDTGYFIGRIGYIFGFIILISDRIYNTLRNKKQYVTYFSEVADFFIYIYGLYFVTIYFIKLLGGVTSQYYVDGEYLFLHIVIMYFLMFMKRVFTYKRGIKLKLLNYKFDEYILSKIMIGYIILSCLIFLGLGMEMVFLLIQLFFLLLYVGEKRKLKDNFELNEYVAAKYQVILDIETNYKHNLYMIPVIIISIINFEPVMISLLLIMYLNKKD